MFPVVDKKDLQVIVVISMLAAGRESSGQNSPEELTAMKEAAEATSKALGSFTGNTSLMSSFLFPLLMPWSITIAL